MRVVIFAGGNQTRFGKSVNEQSKVLYPLMNNHTILSAILRELDDLDLESIHIASKDKTIIKDYVDKIKSDFHTPIFVDERKDSQGAIVMQEAQCFPCTFIFGDTYFAKASLKKYMNAAKAATHDMDGFIGLHKNHVGDFRVTIKSSRITELSKNLQDGYFICGLFSMFNKNMLTVLKSPEKITHVFEQLMKSDYKIGYQVLQEDIVDLDTQDLIPALEKTVKKSVKI